jgi:hypothetical protein
MPNFNPYPITIQYSMRASLTGMNVPECDETGEYIVSEHRCNGSIDAPEILPAGSCRAGVHDAGDHYAVCTTLWRS